MKEYWFLFPECLMSYFPPGLECEIGIKYRMKIFPFEKKVTQTLQSEWLFFYWRHISNTITVSQKACQKAYYGWFSLFIDRKKLFLSNIYQAVVVSENYYIKKSWKRVLWTNFMLRKWTLMHWIENARYGNKVIKTKTLNTVEIHVWELL